MSPPSRSFDSNGAGSEERPTKDFEELFACLNARRVKAIIVGGHAVAFHAKPRFTKDVDLLVEPSRENAERLVRALEDFGFTGLGLSADDFTAPGKVVQLGVAPNRVDLVTSIDAVGFEEAWNGRATGRFGEQSVSYLGKAELIKKRSSSRTRGRAAGHRTSPISTGSPEPGTFPC